MWPSYILELGNRHFDDFTRHARRLALWQGMDKVHPTLNFTPNRILAVQEARII